MSIKPKSPPAPIDLILETSSVLFFCGAAYAVFALYRQGITSAIELIVATSLPAAASLLLLFAAFVVPGLYAVRRLAFPLNITLPLLHGAMVFMLAELTRGSFGLESPPKQLVPALAWSDVVFLGLAVVLQVVVLTFMLWIKAGTEPGPTTSDVQR